MIYDRFRGKTTSTFENKPFANAHMSKPRSRTRQAFANPKPVVNIVVECQQC